MTCLNYSHCLLLDFMKWMLFIDKSNYHVMQYMDKSHLFTGMRQPFVSAVFDESLLTISHSFCLWMFNAIFIRRFDECSNEIR